MLRLALRVARSDFAVAADLSVGTGEVLCLLGHTGAGKTTLLNAVAGAEPSEGRLEVGGRALQALQAHRRAIAVVPQRPRPLPTGSVRDQIAFATPEGRLDAETEALVDAFDLRSLIGRPGRHLSGGEAQRLAIVQALCSRPAAIALDEPLSAQDPGRRRSLGPRLRAWAQRSGLPVLWATHDVAEAQRVADRVAVLDRGRVVLEAAVEAMLERPPTWHVARLLGYDGWAPLAAGEAALLHPDRLRLGTPAADEMAFPGRVAEVRPHGGGHLVTVALTPAGEAVVALYGPGAPPAPGHAVTVCAGEPPRLALAPESRPW